MSVLSPSTPAVQQDPKMHPSAVGGAGCPGGCGPWRPLMRASQEEAVVGVEQWAEIPRMHSWRGCRSRRSRGELAAIATRCGALCGRGSRRAMSGGRGRRSWIPSARRSTGLLREDCTLPGQVSASACRRSAMRAAGRSWTTTCARSGRSSRRRGRSSARSIGRSGMPVRSVGAQRLGPTLAWHRMPARGGAEHPCRRTRSHISDRRDARSG
jgi:hypothetical protein